MRQNYKGNKRRKEEKRKKKQEEKRQKRLNRKGEATQPNQAGSGLPEENSVSFPTEDQDLTA